MKVSLILACAGKGTRTNLKENKLLYKVDGMTIIEKTLSAFYASGLVDQYIVVASNQDYDYVKSILPSQVEVVKGGNTRTQSVKNGLKLVSNEIVLIHDGARPFVTKEVILDCIETAKIYGSAIPVVPCANTICTANENGIIENYLGKSGLYQIQTPQGFLTSNIIKAYSQVENAFNDDGEVYKTFFGDVHTSKGHTKNIKLTYREDFENLNAIQDFKVGVGFDCHKLVENRKLILGGIKVPHNLGLLGHSDADALTHAIMDAMLSAVGQRDIGYHFPDTNEKYKDANSIELLKKVIDICKDSGYKIKSLSAVIMAQKPKLLNFIPLMVENLAKTLSLSANCVGIGATTLEGLGFVGREEGICVNASVIMQKI